MEITTELQQFNTFKKEYKFEQKEIIEIEGEQYCENMPLLDENGEIIGECEKWINVGYKHKGLYAKVLSNLFPYEFEMRGKKLSSIEAFFQGIKFKDIEMQNLVFSYSGLDACRVKICNDYNWTITGKLYWQGEEIDRYSKEYDLLVDEMYISAIQNPLFRNVLRKCEKDIIHSIGKNNKNETVFTRLEFEKEINCLKDFTRKLDISRFM